VCTRHGLLLPLEAFEKRKYFGIGPCDLRLSQRWILCLPSSGLWRRFGATCCLNLSFSIMNMQSTDCSKAVVPVYQSILRSIPEDGNIDVRANSALDTPVIIVRVRNLCDHFAVLFPAKLCYVKTFVVVLLLVTDLCNFCGYCKYLPHSNHLRSLFREYFHFSFLFYIYFFLFSPRLFFPSFVM
jgi:hypothetical protein